MKRVILFALVLILCAGALADTGIDWSYYTNDELRIRIDELNEMLKEAQAELDSRDTSKEPTQEAIKEFMDARKLVIATNEQIEAFGFNASNLKKNGYDFSILAYNENETIGNIILWYDGENEYYAVDMARVLLGGGGNRDGGANQWFYDMCNEFKFDMYAFVGKTKTGYYIPNENVKDQIRNSEDMSWIEVYTTKERFLAELLHTIKNH